MITPIATKQTAIRILKQLLANTEESHVKISRGGVEIIIKLLEEDIETELKKTP